MRENEEFIENLKHRYNFPDVKWLGRSLEHGHKFDIILSEYHMEIYKSKIGLLEHYALQAQMSTAEKYGCPLNLVKDICYNNDSGHLIIEGPKNSIKVFVFYIFSQ